MTIRGLAFPFGRSSFGLPAPATDEDVIADNIERIIQTPRGSRVMRPDAGSDTYAFVFESTGPLLRARIDHEVRRAVSAGEPRASILRVDTTERETDDGIEIVVDVTFEVLGVVRRASTSFSP
jgi:phage baseplate assembly protein W